MKPSKILLVEDEADVKDLMRVHLLRDGHEVEWVDDGDQALKMLARNEYQLGIFDWMLPGVSGLELCRAVRGKLPILMVTARADNADVIMGLEMGADDYITKPFEIPVFMARVRALLRRSHTPDVRETFLRNGQLTIHTERHDVRCGETEIDLTASEFKLLAVLMENAGKVLSREKLIKSIQGEGISVTDRVIDTHVFGLRKKLGTCGDFIETIRGVGYRVKAE